MQEAARHRIGGVITKTRGSRKEQFGHAAAATPQPANGAT
jgi:hypothetical protein